MFDETLYDDDMDKTLYDNGEDEPTSESVFSEIESDFDYLKKKIISTTMKQIEEHIEYLEREVERLHNIEQEKNEAERELMHYKFDFDSAVKAETERIARERANKIIRNVCEVGYLVSTDYGFYFDKCDKCDVFRDIQITLPDGRKASYKCKCGEKRKIASFRKVYLYEISVPNLNNSEVSYTYKYYFDEADTGSYSDDYVRVSSDSILTPSDVKFTYDSAVIISTNDDLLKSYHHRIFTSEETAKILCAIINESEVKKVKAKYNARKD